MYCFALGVTPKEPTEAYVCHVVSAWYSGLTSNNDVTKYVNPVLLIFYLGLPNSLFTENLRQ